MWPQLAATMTGPGRRGCGAALLAIAYIGSEADTWLHLRAGDVVVCDASARAVRMGMTSVPQLRRWYEAGVQVASREGLHAKVGVIGSRAFVGSANASRMSADERDEAVFITSSPQVVRGLRSYVKSLGDGPTLVLDDAALDELAKLPVRQPQWPRHAPADRVPVPPGARVFLWEWEDDTRGKRGEEAQDSEIGRQYSSLLARADRLLATRLEDDGELRRWSKGDVITWSNPDGRVVYPPAVVVAKTPRARGVRPALYYRHRGDLRQLPRTMVERALLTADPKWKRRKD